MDCSETEKYYETEERKGLRNRVKNSKGRIL